MKGCPACQNPKNREHTCGQRVVQATLYLVQQSWRALLLATFVGALVYVMSGCAREVPSISAQGQREEAVLALEEARMFWFAHGVDFPEGDDIVFGEVAGLSDVALYSPSENTLALRRSDGYSSTIRKCAVAHELGHALGMKHVEVTTYGPVGVSGCAMNPDMSVIACTEPQALMAETPSKIFTDASKTACAWSAMDEMELERVWTK